MYGLRQHPISVFQLVLLAALSSWHV